MITNSSAYSSNNVNALLNFDTPYNFRTSKEEKNPFITFDFGTRRGCIESYAIRTYNGDHYPINWQIQGSVDGKNFNVLDERNDNICKDNLTARSTGVIVCNAYIVKTYEVKNQMCVRYLRLQQIGENSEHLNNPNKDDGWHNTLYLSGFDAYGVPMIPLNLCFQTIKHKFKINQSLYFFILICFS